MLARIGEGGMGSVYFSYSRGGQAVAVKLIRREFGDDPEFRLRFEQEVRAARMVRGYHLVPVVDHDTSGEQPWLASTYIPGMPLHEALTSHGPLPLPSVLALVGMAAQALGAMHTVGVIHRDLKPGNILLGADGPHVIDFGIARAADATHITRSGRLIGTPQFMSPEQTLGEEVGPPSDVFSLGLIAAVAATGRHPYGEGGAVSIGTRIANTEARPPSLDGYEDGLRELLAGCLAQDPAARTTPAELAARYAPPAALEGWLPAPLAAEIARRTASVPPVPGPAAPPPPKGVPDTPPPRVAGVVAAGTTVPPVAGAGTTVPPVAGAGTTLPPRTDAGTAPTDPPPPTAAPTGPGTGAPPYGTVPPMPYPGQPLPQTGRQPSRMSDRRRGLLAGAAILLVAVGVVIWSQSGPDGSGSGDKAVSSDPATTAGTDRASQGAESPEKSSSPKPTYTVVFKNKPLLIRAPQNTDTSVIDFDAPRLNPQGSSDSEDTKGQEILYENSVGAKWEFLTPAGTSSAATPEACRDAVGTSALQDLDEYDLRDGKPLGKGTIVCTVTTDGNLAMMKIVDWHLADGDYTVPGFDTELTLWKINE
ncbi:serine/threonine protein kinase [Streptomyces sp. NPDC059783]|uniref:serine/threonine protein kinase n=1 Tax=Streptomyces sp. NPDC059783 TaxID=3346944 RepID=UPI0036660C7C